MSTPTTKELTYGAPVEYHSGKAGSNQVFRGVFLRKHERSSGEYAEIARELGRWNNPDNGHTHIVEWVPIAALRSAPQPDVARLVDLPPAHKEYLEAIGYDTVKAFSKAIGVKYMMVGELKVKDTSALIYKGLVLPVLGYYMKWPVQGSVGDGWDEYRVSLIGKGFEYQETNIATGDIEWIKAERWGHAAKATIPAVAPKDE
jgi:hypothetical protein